MESDGDPAHILRSVWGNYHPTRLLSLPLLAQDTGVAHVLVKAENERRLGNFKSLGGTVASLRGLARMWTPPLPIRDLLSGKHGGRLPKLLCASDGNHGLAVAAAARDAGTAAVVYLPVGATPSRAARIEAAGARVAWVDGTYDDAVLAAQAAAANGDGLLIPDTSADPDDPVIRDVLDGYSIMPREIAAQLGELNVDGVSHVFLQAGVGGFAAAMAAGLRETLANMPAVVIVEPEAAACVTLALRKGHPQQFAGNLQTCAEMLSCGVASAGALAILSEFQPRTVLVTEEQLAAAPKRLLAAGGPATTPSGAAALAGLLQAAQSPSGRASARLDERSVVLLVATEGAIDLH